MTESKQWDQPAEALKKLRDPFPPEQIGKLPKGGILLDFVGHGFITQRLLDVDPFWHWEPFALDSDGLPLLDENGGLWIRLTVCGVTRIGYGDAGGRRGPNAIKEAIGDALRNAGMRFGLALELWCKGDPDAPAPVKPRSAGDVAREEFAAFLKSNRLKPADYAARFVKDHGMDIREADADTVKAFQQLISQELEPGDG